MQCQVVLGGSLSDLATVHLRVHVCLNMLNTYSLFRSRCMICACVSRTSSAKDMFGTTWNEGHVTGDGRRCFTILGALCLKVSCSRPRRCSFPYSKEELLLLPRPFFVIPWLSYFDLFSLMWEHFLDETANGYIGRAEGKIMLVCNRQYSWDYQMPMSLIVYYFAVAPSYKSPQIGNLHCRRW